jgi:serine/threonine protein kinase/WD40 repeat protein
LNAHAHETHPDRGEPQERPDPGPDDARDQLEILAEQFLDRIRGGEQPPVSEFLALAPDRKTELEQILSALLFVEDVRKDPDATSVSAAAGSPVDRPAVERLGDFRILRELGRGGMGIVYEAEQESLNRHVAIKVLGPGTARSPQIVERFLREARAAAQLHHTNIVPVFGVGQRDGLHFYAMQLIRGLSLDKVLQEVRRQKDPTPSDAPKDPTPTDPPDELTAIHPVLAGVADSDERYARSVARIGLEVAQALDYAHQQGTLHRDIKPSNILLDVHGVAWVTDFGLAKAVEDEDLTRTGDFVGTIRYMAPERLLGHCDGRSDAYSLGLTLYEMLALRPAFLGSDRETLLHQVSRVEPTRLRTVAPAIPVDLETIIHKSVEKEPEHRYKHAAALAEDLRSFLADRPIAARRVSSTERLTRWARRNPGLATLGTALAAMLALVVAVIGVADLRLRRKHEEAVKNLTRAELAESDAVSKLLDSYVSGARAGRRSRFAGQRFEGLRALRSAALLDQPGDRRLELRNEAIACLALPDLDPVRPWSYDTQGYFLGVDIDPTSSRMARGTPEGDVLIRGALAPNEDIRLPGKLPRVVMARFSPDGRYLAVKHQHHADVALVVWDTQPAVKILHIPEGVDGDALDFHPGGRMLAAGRRDGTIVLYDLDAKRELRRFAPGPVPQSLRFDSSGERIVIASRRSRDGIQVRSVKDGTTAATWTLPEAPFWADWHPDGRRLAVGGELGTIRLLDARDPRRPARTLGSHDTTVVALAFHPQGRLLASVSWDGTARLWDISSRGQLLKCAIPEARPLRFSRDGRLLGPGLDGASAWSWEVAEGLECRWRLWDEVAGERSRWVDFVGSTSVLASAGESGVRLEALGGDASAYFALPGTAGIAADPNGSFLITSGITGLLRWPVAQSQERDLRLGPPEPIGSLAGIPTGRVRMSRDGRTLATVLDDEIGRVVVLDLQGRMERVALAAHPEIERLDISPDGHWVATGTWRGTGVKVWDARTGALAREFATTGSADARFSPDGRSLVIGCGEEYAVWNVASWSRRLQVPRRQAISLPGPAAFSPEGGLIAIMKTRSLVQLLDAESGRELATLEAPVPKAVDALAFSPDGGLLVLAQTGAGILVWDLAAIRRGLDSLRLNWRSPKPIEPASQPAPVPGRIVVEQPPWMDPLTRGEELANAGQFKEAAAAFDQAFDSGARHVDAQVRRVLLRQARENEAAYGEACRQLLQLSQASELVPRVANEIAWACSRGPGALTDYAPVVHLAELAAASGPANDRLNTLGASLYRSGRFEEAVRQLMRAVALHGASGTELDALFLAMAHHKLGNAGEARRWLRLGTLVDGAVAPRPGARGDNSWMSRLELAMLRREASAMIKPSPP